jgi:anti-anti-sigma factor
MNASLLERNLFLPESFVQRPEGCLEFEIEKLGDSVAVVRIRGEADSENAVELGEQLKLRRKPGSQFIILDMAELRFIGPEALQVFAELAKDACQRGGEVWLTGLQPAVWLALHSARLDRMFTIRESLTVALSS